MILGHTPVLFWARASGCNKGKGAGDAVELAVCSCIKIVSQK
jgi:hypothetical protein